MASFTDLLNFSRASVGYYWDAAGNLVQAAVDTPRFDYTPMTGNQPGLLIEPSVTEDNKYSTVTTSQYTSVSSSTLTDLTLNALGQFPGISVASGGSVDSVARPLVANRVAVTNGVVRLLEFYYRVGTSGLARFAIFNETANQTSIVNGTPGSLNVISTSAGPVTIVSDDLLKDGLTRRLRLRWTPAADGLLSMRVGPQSTTVGQTIIWLGFFTPTGPHFTTPILTSGSTVTRSADIVSVKQTPYWMNQTEGTFVGEFRFGYEDTNVADQVRLFHITQGNDYALNGHAAYIGTLSTVTGRVNYSIRNTTQVTVQGTATDYSPGYNRLIKVGASYDADSFALCFNGGTAYSGVPTPGIPNMSAESVVLGGTAPVTVLDFRYMPTSSTSAQLQELTT